MKIETNLSQTEVNEQAKSYGLVIICVLAITVVISVIIGPCYWF